ncbi:MAG: hypothetical protein IPL78_34725 [Chloroflexi bacterium]|nr:hypothetical protein [Chloroflexota bacterium]
MNGRYFPATDSWQTISTTSAPPALLPSLVWTGTEMIAWVAAPALVCATSPTTMAVATTLPPIPGHPPA